MGDLSPNIFDTEKEGGINEENVEEPAEEAQEEQEEDRNSSEEDKQPDYDPWLPFRRKAREDVEEQCMKKVKRFLNMAKTQAFAKSTASNAYYFQVGEGYVGPTGIV